MAADNYQDAERVFAWSFYSQGTSEQVTSADSFISEALTWFEAKVTDVVKRGDHTLFVAEVIEAGVRDEEGKPLQLSSTGWSYGG